jgi:hypothetical protein
VDLIFENESEGIEDVFDFLGGDDPHLLVHTGH